MADLNRTLYQVLTKPDKNIILKPGIFVNDYNYENDALTFNTVGYGTRSFTHFFRLYIPFSQRGSLIPDFNNEIFTVYPLYNIMVIETATLNDPKMFTLQAVYNMGSNQFDEVYLDDNLEEVPIYKATEVAAIKRYVPKAFEPTQSMREFFNAVTTGETKINVVNYKR